MKSFNGDIEISMCTACGQSNEPFELFCRSCGAPTGRTATLDPVNSIQTQGFLFRRAVDAPPGPIALAGMWILFFPVLIGSIYAAIRLIMIGGGLGNFVFFWAFVGLAYMSAVILYRVTKRYIGRGGTARKIR